MRAKNKMKATDEITNSEEIIDSRDIIARIEHLESERQPLVDAIDEADENEIGSESLLDAQEKLDEWDESDEGQELKALQSLAEEAEGYAPDWNHGEALIHDSHFEDYAREMAEDIGAISGDEKWPCTCIDWEKAASELQQDYTAVEFSGVTYWIR